MKDFFDKFKAWGNTIRKKRLYIFMVALIIAFFVITVNAFNSKKKYRLAIENNYNMTFYQLTDYVQNVEVYLAKATICNSPESSAETLSYIWRESNLAQTYLSMLPITSYELENTAKFLNQVSDYSYALTKKTINNEELSQSDFDNINKLHDYSVELKNTLNQLSADLNDGKISWHELTQEIKPAFSQQVSNITKDSFSSLEENFHEYAGLIYDGAYSEHLTNSEHKGLYGEDISEEQAKKIAIDFMEKEQIKETKSNGISQNANIESYSFVLTSQDGNTTWISVSKKGGHVVSMNCNRDVFSENLKQEDIDKMVENFLESKGFANMKKTYFTKLNGIETINYAYVQEGVTIYPDLIKVKVAMDNGEILGIETTGYLNSHTERKLSEIKISKEEAQSKINKNLEIQSVRLAIIPTEFQTEFMCWEFKGKVNEREFLVYINVENGKEEDILMILNSDQGTLTM